MEIHSDLSHTPAKLIMHGIPVDLFIMAKEYLPIRVQGTGLSYSFQSSPILATPELEAPAKE